MGHFYLLIALGVLVLLAFLMSLRASLRRRLRLPYTADETLFSAPQRAFKRVLERAVGKDYRIYGKVRAIDVIRLEPRLPRREQERALERLEGYCFDFLVCSRDSTAILCAVSLAPHSRLRKLPRKDGLDRICAAARLPFVRFRESEHYSVVEIEERIFAAMQARGAVPKVDEVSTDEAEHTLQGLSSVIQTERRPERVRPRPAPIGSRVSREPGLTARPRVEEPAPARDVRRRDPTIRDDQILDEGPSFKIEGDLDEERALYSRTSR